MKLKPSGRSDGSLFLICSHQGETLHKQTVLMKIKRNDKKFCWVARSGILIFNFLGKNKVDADIPVNLHFNFHSIKKISFKKPTCKSSPHLKTFAAIRNALSYGKHKKVSNGNWLYGKLSPRMT